METEERHHHHHPEMEVNKEVVDTRNITVAEQDTIVIRDHRLGEES